MTIPIIVAILSPKTKDESITLLFYFTCIEKSCLNPNTKIVDFYDNLLFSNDFLYFFKELRIVGDCWDRKGILPESIIFCMFPQGFLQKHPSSFRLFDNRLL